MLAMMLTCVAESHSVCSTTGHRLRSMQSAPGTVWEFTAPLAADHTGWTLGGCVGEAGRLLKFVTAAIACRHAASRSANARVLHTHSLQGERAQ